MATDALNRTLGESAQYVADELVRRGVRLNPSSRLGKYARVFAKNGYSGTCGLGAQERLLEGLMAMRDVDEIAMILDEFPSIAGDDLQKLVVDTPVPRLDHATPGRDRQHELYVGAICQRGKMSPNLDREPDLWCQVSSAWLGLAVKRVRSAKQFQANLEDASGQIEKCALSYGFAVMDVSLAWNPDIRTVFTARSSSEVALDYRERLTRLLDANVGSLGSTWRKYSKVLGLLCVDLTFTHHERDGWARDQFSVFCFSSKNDRHRNRLAQAFRVGWMRGSPNCIDLESQPRTGRFTGPPIDKVVALRPTS